MIIPAQLMIAYLLIGLGFALAQTDHADVVRLVRRDHPNASAFTISFWHTIFCGFVWPYFAWVNLRG